MSEENAMQLICAYPRASGFTVKCNYAFLTIHQEQESEPMLIYLNRGEVVELKSALEAALNILEK